MRPITFHKAWLSYFVLGVLTFAFSVSCSPRPTPVFSIGLKPPPPISSPPIQQIAQTNEEKLKRDKARIKISFSEAAAVAKAFMATEGVSSEYKLDTMRLFSGNTEGQIYTVGFKRPTDNAKIDFVVDAYSGDLVSAENSIRTSIPRHEVISRPDAWLKRAGFNVELSKVPETRGYRLEVAGHPFINDHDRTLTGIHHRGTDFVAYEGLGASPPPPSGKAAISEAKALQIAAKTPRLRYPDTLSINGSPTVPRARTAVIEIPPGTAPKTLKPVLCLFYDQGLRSTRWVWKVVHGFVSGGNFFRDATTYIDGQDGHIVEGRDILVSEWKHNSRGPRVGLIALGPRVEEVRLFAAANKVVLALGRSGIPFSYAEMDSGLHLGAGSETEMVLDANGNLVSFKSPRSEGKFDPQKALIKGKKLILSQHPKLPEGSFQIAKIPWNYTEVAFQQRALGYDYLGSGAVVVDFNEDGSIFKYTTNLAAQLPKALPARVQSRAEIEKAASDLATPFLEHDTDRIHNSVRATVGDLGWYVASGSSEPRLCYSVQIMSERTFKFGGSQGGGGYYMFDAETGKCLQKYP